MNEQGMGEEMRKRIEDQRVAVDALVPGSFEHVLALKVLLLLQDGLDLFEQTQQLMRASKELDGA